MQPKPPELFEVDTTDAMFSSSQLLQEQDRAQGPGVCSASQSKWNRNSRLFLRSPLHPRGSCHPTQGRLLGGDPDVVVMP